MEKIFLDNLRLMVNTIYGGADGRYSVRDLGLTGSMVIVHTAILGDGLVERTGRGEYRLNVDCAVEEFMLMSVGSYRKYQRGVSGRWTAMMRSKRIK